MYCLSIVALNPTDWQHISFMTTPGALLGCDYADTVLELGEETIQKSDCVCGMCHGVNLLELENGAFAEYIVAKGGNLNEYSAVNDI